MPESFFANSSACDFNESFAPEKCVSNADMRRSNLSNINRQPAAIVPGTTYIRKTPTGSNRWTIYSTHSLKKVYQVASGAVQGLSAIQDFCDSNPITTVDFHHLSSRDHAIVHHQLHRIVRLAVQFDDGSRLEF